MDWTREGVGGFGVEQCVLAHGLRRGEFDCMLDMTLVDKHRA